MTAQPLPTLSPAARRLETGFLNVFVMPATVAVFGATKTPGSVGRAVMSNLICNPFGGILFPVSPAHWRVLGVKAHRSLAAVPERVVAEIRKPLLAVCLWGASSPEALATLAKAGIPTFPCPDSAVRTFGYLWRYGANLRALATDRETTEMGRG